MGRRNTYSLAAAALLAFTVTLKPFSAPISANFELIRTLTKSIGRVEEERYRQCRERYPVELMLEVSEDHL